jgi:hypothetical protein
MERGEGVLVHGLDRHRTHVLVAQGLEQPLRIGAVRLVARDVGAHGVRRQQHHPVPARLRFAAPVVGGATGFHHHRRRGLLREEPRELPPREPMASAHLARALRHRHLEHGLG